MDERVQEPDSQYAPEGLSPSYWRRIADKRADELKALRQENERLAAKLMTVTSSVDELSRQSTYFLTMLERELGLRRDV